MTMKMPYDPEVDALHIELRDDAIAKSVDLEAGVTLDYDASGQVIGIEILDVRPRIDVALMATSAATTSQLHGW
jgi:uncharacterized protein YuzE